MKVPGCPNQQEAYLDICELCGGHEARANLLAIRRMLEADIDFGLVCSIGRDGPTARRQINNCIHDHNILAVVVAWSCRTPSPTSNPNYRINYEQRLHLFETNRQHFEFCGQVFRLQAHNKWLWLAATSWPTWAKPEELLPPRSWGWSMVANVVHCVIDLNKRCRHATRSRAHNACEGNHRCPGCDSKPVCSQQKYNHGAGQCKYHATSPEDTEYTWTCLGCARMDADGNTQPRSAEMYNEDAEPCAEPP